MSGVSESVAGVSESNVEEAALGRLAALGWTVARGPDGASDTPDVRGHRLMQAGAVQSGMYDRSPAGIHRLPGRPGT